MDIVINIFIFALGAAIGSFLNVCIHRFPRGESIIAPGSHCPHCMKPIAWFENIPLLSFLILRGKCSSCQKEISPRYFFVELITGMIWLHNWLQLGLSASFFTSVTLMSILLSVCITDLETGYIPDKFTFPGMAAGLVFSALLPPLQGQEIWYGGLAQSFIGFLAGGGILLVIGLIGNFIFRKESMGGGDIKLLAMLGTFLGYKGAFLVFFFSPVLALPVAIPLKIFRRAETIPFGPFLAITGAVAFIYGHQNIDNLLSFYLLGRRH